MYTCDHFVFCPYYPRLRLSCRVGRVSSIFSAFLQMISRKPTQIGSQNLTYECSTMSHDKPFFGVKRSKIKVTTSVSIFGQNATLPLLRTLATLGFPCCNTPPATQAMLATLGCTCRWTLDFPRRGVLHSCDHWRRQQWGTEARAPSIWSNFQCTLTYTKSDSDCMSTVV